jgi:hypothetical protein
MKYILVMAGLAIATHPVFAFISPKVNPATRNNNFALKVAADEPNTQIAVHNVNDVSFTVSNMGQFGTGYLGSVSDPLTGEQAPSAIYPTGSNVNYLYVGGFWIGAVVGRDTLVSIGVDDYYSVVEFWPDPAPRGEITYQSIEPSSAFYTSEAVSEQDIIAIYTDTVTNSRWVATDDTDRRPHKPLNIEVTQRSYAWSYDYAKDFILFDYSIKSIGRSKLEKVYMGIYIDGDVHHTSFSGESAYMDDLCGFIKTFPAGVGCGYLDTVNFAYIMDNNGDPVDQSSFGATSCRGAGGVRVVRTPSDSLSYSFNWWATDYSPAHDFGPRRAGTPEDPFRDMNGVLGTPLGDKNKYYVMRHQEFDYDELFTGKDHTGEGWLPRPSNAANIADGFDTRYLLSFGPFDISPGEVLPLTFAYIFGDNVHTRPDNFSKYYNMSAPEDFYNTLDFSEISTNSKWASWIFDNPNFDTDGDDYKGKYRVCCTDSTIQIDFSKNPPETTIVYLKCDTNFYEGDRIPDFRGASPPPAPVLRVYPRLNEFNSGEIVVRWNGYNSELTKDVFSNRYDFEGYRVYQSLTPKTAGFILLASYDVEDYNRWIWNEYRGWQLLDPPFTIDSLRQLYGTNFQPLSHGVDDPLYISNPGGADSAFYFTRQDWNASDLADTTKIYQRYTNQPYPTTLNYDSAAVYYPDELTEDGLFKYFEYEYTLRNLLPSQLYYISVTAYDYGSPGHALGALETKQTINMVAEYPQNSSSVVEEKDLKVIVYPNPYRIDGNYRNPEGGSFEGRGEEDAATDRVRAIHFTNLPHKCTIRIFTLDGDLVREIDHNVADGSTQSMHDKWDLITRNTQAAVSGIYYYVIESEYGNQIGKLVIIM